MKRGFLLEAKTKRDKKKPSTANDATPNPNPTASNTTNASPQQRQLVARDLDFGNEENFATIEEQLKHGETGAQIDLYHIREKVIAVALLGPGKCFLLHWTLTPRGLDAMLHMTRTPPDFADAIRNTFGAHTQSTVQVMRGLTQCST